MVHIYPLNDTKEHGLTGTDCWCEPRIEFKDPMNGEYYATGLVIHNAGDFREVLEELDDLPRLAFDSWALLVFSWFWKMGYICSKLLERCFRGKTKKELFEMWIFAR